MSAVLLAPIIDFYRTILQPVQLFQWFGVTLTSLDVAAAFRLCLVMRQLREVQLDRHVEAMKVAHANANLTGTPVTVQHLERRSFVREASAVLLVVYGGEALTAPFLGTPPSFVISGVVPMLYVLMQALVEHLPTIPQMSLNTELPLSAWDGISRAYLLCNLVAPAVLTHANADVATSPWTLLLTSFVTANTGFFVVNLFSFLQPHALSLCTPAEMQPYGWTTTDLWCAPAITGLYSLLTHAQPFWADAHAVLMGWLGSNTIVDGKMAEVEPVDEEVARALCAAILAVMFSVRTAKNFGGEWMKATVQSSEPAKGRVLDRSKME